ncbi:uncharacterized protein KQ657_003408 [Scheffersomyces spartinae]|uniref:C2H2-type domain-containing protein n=1 Tax=Scheffersomyces spartinae TaxID=45513 RepID=A0A9P7VE65_9ASCO|nr:uncharacterized protein KQ657_003408 [Scheffersomyces spartinae]KAG7195641.1 hypothetical protein KQ657_003408 [Scheffersomyces spartinae]
MFRKFPQPAIATTTTTKATGTTTTTTTTLGGVFSHIISLLYTKWSSSKSLFPRTSRIANISNSLRGPRLCAADDLEFSYESEQIDLFYNRYAQQPASQTNECAYNNSITNNNVNNSFDNYPQPAEYSDQTNRNPNVVNINAITSAHSNVGPSNVNSANGGMTMGYDFGYDSALDFSYHSQPYPLATQVHPSKIESHFQWNMSNAGLEYHFNDFQKANYNNMNITNINNNNSNNPNYAALLSTNTSSLQSSDISPLDDEFFKKINNSKKDTATANIMMELVDQLFHNYLAKNDSDYQFIPTASFGSSQSNNTNLEQRDSVVSESSVGSIEHFEGTPQFPLDSTVEPPFTLAHGSNSLDSRPVKREREDDDEDSKHLMKYQTTSAPKRRKSRKQKPDSYDCPHCDAKFKVKGYLTRHIKKHNSAKAFTCPFYQDDAVEGEYSPETKPNNSNMASFAPRNPSLPGGIVGTKCHPTGGFTRRDTFKTHLKALHFIYPPGTKLSERNMIEGRCAGCFQHFKNNAEWLETHIERGECQGSVRSFNGSNEVIKNEHSHDQLHYVQL